MRDPFPIVARLGDRLDKSRTGWAEMKALVIIAGRESWDAGAALCDALGIGPDQQETIHREIQDHPDGIDTPKAHRSKRREP